MIELISLEPQKDFPVNDISDDNAATLELLLADSTIREACHHTAEEHLRSTNSVIECYVNLYQAFQA